MGFTSLGFFAKEVFMESNADKTQNLFDQFGLQVSTGDVEIGKTYPIYGMITNLLSDTPGEIMVEINFSIKAHMTIPDQQKINVLKERAFEPGIFVSKILSKEEGIEVDCSTVVFGKRQNFQA